MHHSGLAPRSQPALRADSSGKKESSLFVLLALTFVAIWVSGWLRPRDPHFLLCYLVPPLLTFNACRRRTMLGVAALSISATVVEFLLLRATGGRETEGVTAVFSVMLQSMICYLALRQWRILAEEQGRRARRDAELREVSSNLDALERSRLRLARRNRELAVLNDIAACVSRAASLAQAVGYALDRVAELYSGATALLVGRGAQGYEFLAQRGWSEAEEARMHAADWGALLDELKIAGDRAQVIKAGREWFARGERAAIYTVFPIVDGQQSLGVLLVGGSFGEDDLSFLAALTNQLASAMVRDRLTREARAQAERQLAVERRLTRLLTGNAPVAMAQLTPEMEYVMANPAYLTLMRAQSGDAALDLVGRRWKDFFPRDAHSPQWHDEVAHYIRHGLPFTAQAQASRSHDGGVTYWDWTVWPVKDEVGRTESVLLLGTEITDRIHARRQLEEALADAWTERNKLEAVIENITDAVFITDARTQQVVRVNSAAARLLGFEDRQELEEQLRENPLLMECAKCEATPGSGGVDCLAEEWLIPATRGETRRDVYRVWWRRDGTPVQVIVGSSPVRNSSGEVTLAVSTAHDVTRLLEIQDELERSNRTKDVFLAMLSHELRTPLTPVLGWVRILRQQLHDEQVLARGLNVIERNARLQAQLVDDLLDLSRIALGKVELRTQPTDLNEVVRRALETVQGSLDEKRLAVELDLASQPLVVSGDARRLEQIIWNLLSNAIKFSSPGGHIRIRSWVSEKLCHLEVGDDGMGIAADVLPTIFAPFRQADSSITRRHGGLGIGLAIAQSLVELHGGRIAAESAGEGTGARFTVSLPVHVARHRARAAAPATHPSARLEGLRVLVLEDSPDTRELLGLLLRSYGCEVALAADVSQGLRLAAETKPELILSDIGLPEADGYEFIQRLRDSGEFAHTPVIALTGYAMESDRQRVTEAGFDLHLSKPIDPELLLAAIHKLRARQTAVSASGGAQGRREFLPATM